MGASTPSVAQIFEGKIEQNSADKNGYPLKLQTQNVVVFPLVIS